MRNIYHFLQCSVGSTGISLEQQLLAIFKCNCKPFFCVDGTFYIDLNLLFQLDTGFRGGPPRGGPRGAPRGQSARGRGAGHSRDSLKFDGEFDFESSNAQFDKEEIERELKQKLTLGMRDLQLEGTKQKLQTTNLFVPG